MSGESEKQLIEKYSADAFIEKYNELKGTSYAVTKYSDSPDVICRDKDGNILNIEVTMTEDVEGDIPAMLGRSDARSIENMKKLLDEGKYIGSCLQGNVSDQLVKAIMKKCFKDYGDNGLLLIRDTSGVPWDWDAVVDEKLHDRIKKCIGQYTKGIWLLTRTKEKLFCIHPGE